MQNGHLHIEVPALVAESSGRDFLPDPPAAGYFGPESGQMKGQNPAATGAMVGGGNAAKRISRPLLGAAYSVLDKSIALSLTISSKHHGQGEGTQAKSHVLEDPCSPGNILD